MIAIMQCTSLYPTNDMDVNLSVIPKLKKFLNTKLDTQIILLVI